MDEIEVKVFLTKNGIELLKKRLKALNAKKRPLVFEKNFIYDFADDSLFKSGRLLRLRFVGKKCLMTLKEPIPGTEKSKFKSKKETESLMPYSDGEKTRKLFERSGLLQKWRYDKKREGYELGKISIDIDTLPAIGTFVEVEAKSGKELSAGLRKLGLENEKLSKESYHDVAARMKKIKPDGKLGDLVFK